MPPVIAFIGNFETPNGKALMSLMSELEGRATYVVGNSLEEFEASPLLPEVDVICPVVFAGGKAGLLKDLWSKCPKLRWVHSMAAGVEGLVPIMLEAPNGPETPLTNAKGAFSASLAEYSVAAMLHFNKQVLRLQQNRASKTWDKFIMNELSGKTVGFIGFGDIAQATARLSRAFNVRILALRNSRGASGCDLADEVFYSDDPAGRLEVFRQADYVICSLPGGAATKYFCGEKEFAAMKPTGVFISIGRGTCVDEAALVEALQSGRIAGAALDVFETEPLPTDSPLWNIENLLLSPHNADLTVDYMRLTWNMFLEKLVAYSGSDFAGFDVTVDKAKGY